jgi:hypothetical protein
MDNLRLNAPSYTYSALHSQEIRVLELHPGSSNDPLVCDVVTQKISDKPYEALSYVWGDPTAVTSIKCIDTTNEGNLSICLRYDFMVLIKCITFKFA